MTVVEGGSNDVDCKVLISTGVDDSILSLEPEFEASGCDCVLDWLAELAGSSEGEVAIAGPEIIEMTRPLR